MRDESLTQLQEWFDGCCDGDWEHDHAIKISTIDNPGWHLRVDLSGIALASKPFETLRREITERDWVHCRVRDNIFEAFGGVHNLKEMIAVFLDWAKSEKN